jgi:flagellar hook-associated protein 2
MSYDQLNDKIVVQGKNTRVTSKIEISDSAEGGNLMAVLGLAGKVEKGSDAVMTYDDGSGEQTITRSSNDFTINGIAFSLKKELNSVTDEPIEVSVEGDPTKTIDLIKSFVEKYNELLDKINSELSEKRYLDYPPLTEEQRAEMSEGDIKLWEEKAKSGMLKNDSILSGFVTKMREVLYQEVEGVSAKLYSIGITTGTWDQKGKLVINETKLKEAILNSPDEVIKLFTNESNIRYSPDMSAADRAKRNSENGLANRLYDVMQDYIRTTRNSNGQKGTLLEKAGIVGDVTENNSLISKEIESKEKMISTLLDKLIDKENQYYAKFTAMERYIGQMSSQMAWLTQQMGPGY